MARWRVIRKRAEHLGTVKAPNAFATVLLATLFGSIAVALSWLG
jgi:hypothetical protein